MSSASSSDQTRLLIVEDVPQVAQYIRGLLNTQQAVKLLDVLSTAVGSSTRSPAAARRRDGRRAAAGPDQGPKLVEQIHEAGLGVPVIVLTVPQNPVEVDPAKGVHAVLSMPFSGFELMNSISGVRKQFAESTAVGTTRVTSVFAPKGGVGKTTIAFNLAVAMAQLEQKTVLIDGRSSVTCAPCSRCRSTRPRSSTCRPTASPSRTCPTSCGATRRASTSCWRRRASRWPR